MGLFGSKDDFSKHNIRDAILGILNAAVMVDSKIDDAEVAAIYMPLKYTTLFEYIPIQDISQRSSELLDVWIAGKEEAIKRWVQIIPSDKHRSVFALVADVLLANKEITAEEEKFLQHLAVCMRLDSSEVKNILSVLQLKSAL